MKIHFNNRFAGVVLISLLTQLTVPAHAVTSKLTVPGAPTITSVEAGVGSASIKWRPPLSDGGKAISSYRVTIFPTRAVQVCKSSAAGCLIKITNPDKSQVELKTYPYYFTMASTNAIGTGPASKRSNSVLIKFPPVTTQPASNAPVILTFDGTYKGSAKVVTIFTASQTSTTPDPYQASFTVLNGKVGGSAGAWSIEGTVTDPAGLAKVIVNNPAYGSISLILTFLLDAASQKFVVTGQGAGNFNLPVYGGATIDFRISATHQ